MTSNAQQTQTKPKLEIVRDTFKFQASQFPYRTQVLVYNEKRTYRVDFPMTETLIDMFNNFGPKFYAWGYVDPATNRVHIEEVVSAKEW